MHIINRDLFSSQKYYSGDQIEKNEISWAFSMYGERSDAYIVWVGMPEGKKALEKQGGKREDNVKMDLQEVGWGMD
jgi:hypothetical protein